MGKLMKLYDGEFEISVGDELFLIETNTDRRHLVNVLKVGREYITVILYGREVKFKDGMINDYQNPKFLYKTEESYLEKERQEEFARSIKLQLRYDCIDINYEQSLAIAGILGLSFKKYK